MKWLHISDIHFEKLGYSTEVLRNSLVEKLEEMNEKLDFIMITGDCLYQNKAYDYTIPETKDFIINIGKSIGVPSNKIYICQGNHDLDRKDSERNKIINKCRKTNNYDRESVDKLARLGNQNFRSLFREVKKKEYSDYCVMEPRNLNVRVISINSCLFSKDDYDYKKLRVCNDKLNDLRKKIKKDDKLNILMMHHGVEWLDVTDARSFEHWIEDNRIDAIFCGHTHQAAVDPLNDVNREIMQFTAGALVIDHYAIPSFYICDFNEDEGFLTVTLWSFSTEIEQWAIDNHHLRKFHNNGKHTFTLNRFKKQKQAGGRVSEKRSYEDLFQNLNDRYRNKFNTTKIHSNKSGEDEDFNVWKIIGSLADVGIPYEHALEITIKVVEEITSPAFSADDILQSSSLTHIIYNNIIESNQYLEGMKEYDIGVWASNYARHYDNDKGMIVIDGSRREQITYGLIKSRLLKEVIIEITENELYYDKIFSKELKKMASMIIKFVKSIGVFEIRKDVLLQLIIEYVSEPPHPWFVNHNRDELLEYHRTSAQRHLFKLKEADRKNPPPLYQIEAAYHIFAGFLTIYDDYTGCTEVSPISILRHSLARINEPEDRMIPMRRYLLIQLKKDLASIDISLDHFIKTVNIVYNNIAVEKKVTKQETANALFELKDILDNLINNKNEEAWNKTDSRSTFEQIHELFSNADGFIAKSPVKYFDKKAFFVTPYWDYYQREMYNLGKDILVCMLYTYLKEDGKEEDSVTRTESLKLLVNYLLQENKRQITEIVLFKPDITSFSSEERKSIRELFKKNGINVRCIFIQERDFSMIKENGWRKELFRVLQISKNTKWG